MPGFGGGPGLYIVFLVLGGVSAGGIPAAHTAHLHGLALDGADAKLFVQLISQLHILFLVAGFFAWSIYIGIKMMALLGVVGGMIMVVQTFSLYPVLFDPEAYPFVRLYTAVFLLTAYVQVISMLFLVLEKKANIYYKTVFKARRQLMEEEKLQKQYLVYLLKVIMQEVLVLLIEIKL